MNLTKLKELKRELSEVRKEAVAASIAGDRNRADCLTSKAVGMKSTIDLAEKVLDARGHQDAVGELEGVERVISALSPVPKC